MTGNQRVRQPIDTAGARVARRAGVAVGGQAQTGAAVSFATMPGAAALALAAVPRDSPADHGRA